MQIFRRQKRLNIKRLNIKRFILLFTAGLILLTGCGSKSSGPEGEAHRDGEDKPRFGSECAGYQGFNYLKEYTVLIGYDGDLEPLSDEEATKLTVFLPKASEDDQSIEKNMIYAEADGIRIGLSFVPGPYEMWADLEEMGIAGIGTILENEYTDADPKKYVNIERSELRKTEGASYVTVNYGYYDAASDSYLGVYEIWYEMGINDIYTVDLMVRVIQDQVTEEAEETLKEIEEFYGIETRWDRETADRKAEALKDIVHTTSKVFSNAYVTFELSDDWEEIGFEASDGTQGYFYGNSKISGTNFAMLGGPKEDHGMDYDGLLENGEYLKEYIGSADYGDGMTVQGIWAEEYGDTCLGKAVKIQMPVVNAQGETDEMIHMYYVEGEENVYLIQTHDGPGRTEACDAVERMLLEGKGNQL